MKNSAAQGPQIIGGTSSHQGPFAALRQLAANAVNSIVSLRSTTNAVSGEINAANTIMSFRRGTDPRDHRLVAPFKNDPDKWALIERAYEINQGVVKIVDGKEVVLGPARLGMYGGDVSSNREIEALMSLVAEAVKTGGVDNRGLAAAILRVGLNGAIMNWDGEREVQAVYTRDNQALQEAAKSIVNSIFSQRFRFQNFLLGADRSDYREEQAVETLTNNLVSTLKRGVTYVHPDGKPVSLASLDKAADLGYALNETLKHFDRANDQFQEHERQLLAWYRQSQETLVRMLRKTGVDSDPVEAFSVELDLDIPEWAKTKLAQRLGTNPKDMAIVVTSSEISAKLQDRFDTIKSELNNLDPAFGTKLENKGIDAALKLTRMPLFSRIPDAVANDTAVKRSHAIQRGCVSDSQGRLYLVANGIEDARSLQEAFVGIADAENIWSNAPTYQEYIEQLRFNRSTLHDPDQRKIIDGQLKFLEESKTLQSAVLAVALELMVTTKGDVGKLSGEAGYLRPLPGRDLDPLQQIFVQESLPAVYDLGSSALGLKTRIGLGLEEDPTFLAERARVKFQPTDTERRDAREQQKERRRQGLTPQENAVVEYYESTAQTKSERVVVVSLKDPRGNDIQNIGNTGRPFKVVDLEKFNEAQVALAEFANLKQFREDAGTLGDRARWEKADIDLKQRSSNVRRKLRNLLVEGTQSRAELEVKLKEFKNWIDSVEFWPGMLEAYQQKKVPRDVVAGVAEPVNVAKANGAIQGVARDCGVVYTKSNSYFTKNTVAIDEALTSLDNQVAKMG